MAPTSQRRKLRACEESPIKASPSTTVLLQSPLFSPGVKAEGIPI
jgi:hypothetical protein